MMPEWLSGSVSNGQGLDVATLAFRLALALVLGSAIAALHRATRRKDGAQSRSFAATLVLLAILIAMVTQVIGDSVARAFSLVGALSIVRFRTVVEDTRDTAFVIFAVVVGMAVGVGHLDVAVAGMAAVGLACILLRSRTVKGSNGDSRWRLSVRMGSGATPEDVLGRLFHERFDAFSLVKAASARRGQALELAYRVRLRPAADPAAIVGEINTLEGVQSVELRPA